MIDLYIDGRAATATLNRPPVNAINGAWVERLNRVLDEIEARGVSVLRIRSALPVFCAGFDLETMRELLAAPEGRDALIGIVRQVQEVLARLEALGTVTIAEIGGAAMGGGLELALACDFRVAADTAKLGLPEARLGLIPGAGGTQRLPRLCGRAVASRLILGAEAVDGMTACELGLAQWSVPPADLPSFADDLVERLSSLPAEALAAAKGCIAAAFDDTADGYDRELSETRRLHDVAETRERVRAFLEKTA